MERGLEGGRKKEIHHAGNACMVEGREVTTIEHYKSDHGMDYVSLYKYGKNVQKNVKGMKRFSDHSKLMLNTNLALSSLSPYGQMTCLLLLSVVVWKVDGSSFFLPWLKLYTRHGLVRSTLLVLAPSFTEQFSSICQ